MSSSKASAPLRVVTTPKKALPAIGTRYTPGTLVRMPHLGVYYEVPVSEGEPMDALQRALLADKLHDRSRLMPRTVADKALELIDRVYFAFVGLFGVTR